MRLFENDNLNVVTFSVTCIILFKILFSDLFSCSYFVLWCEFVMLRCYNFRTYSNLMCKLVCMFCIMKVLLLHKLFTLLSVDYVNYLIIFLSCKNMLLLKYNKLFYQICFSCSLWAKHDWLPSLIETFVHLFVLNLFPSYPPLRRPS